MAPRVKRRTAEDWTDELARLSRIRCAADLEIEAGARSARWGKFVRAASDSLALLLVVSVDGEDKAIRAASERLRSALETGS